MRNGDINDRRVCDECSGTNPNKCNVFKQKQCTQIETEKWKQ
jgi:hypothetical protein